MKGNSPEDKLGLQRLLRPLSPFVPVIEDELSVPPQFFQKIEVPSPPHLEKFTCGLFLSAPSFQDKNVFLLEPNLQAREVFTIASNSSLPPLKFPPEADRRRPIPWRTFF